MKVLIVGGGGREHALAWKCAAAAARHARCSSHPATPARRASREVRNVADRRAERRPRRSSRWPRPARRPHHRRPRGAAGRGHRRCVSWPRASRCFGPPARCAQLEGSKAFAKDFLQPPRHPDRRATRTFTRGYLRRRVRARAARAARRQGDGLAAGKGVVIAATHRGGARERATPCSPAVRHRRRATCWSRNSSRARKRASS